MYSDKKLVEAGDKYYYYDFEKEYQYGKNNTPRKRTCSKPIEKTEEEKAAIRERSAWRSRRELQRLIEANVGVWKNEKGRVYLLYFLSLTFASDMYKIKEANNEYRKFIQKINYEILNKKKGSYLKYVCVPEFQKDIDHKGNVKPHGGAVHYHVVIFNLPFMKNVYDRIKKIWGNGFFNLKKINNVKNVGFYVTKYMTKDIVNIKMKQQKKYFASRGLKRPKTYRKADDVDSILGLIPKSTQVSSKPHDLKFGGKFNLTIFDVSKNREAKKNLLALSDLMRLK